MTTESTLFQIASQTPWDDTPWLVYADWLEEHARVEAEWVRTAVDLTARHEPAATARIANLAARIDPAWRQKFQRVWQRRPLVFYVDTVKKLGSRRQRETADRPMTLVTGVLASGDVAFGDRVALPLASRCTSHELVLGEERTIPSAYPCRRSSLAFRGHRIAELNVQIGGVIRRD